MNEEYGYLTWSRRNWEIHNHLTKKLISEFAEDLDEIVGWSKYLPVDSEISIRLGRKVEKWEEKLK